MIREARETGLEKVLPTCPIRTVLEQFPIPERAPSDQAALDTFRPSTYQICAAAQYALGLVTLGSQINPTHRVVRAGNRLLLVFMGVAALWWVANTPPASPRASIDRVLGAIRERSTAL